MNIERINDLRDERFSKTALLQHGAFLADGQPCEVLITGLREAVIHCGAETDVDALIDEFRFFAEHITVFYDSHGQLLRKYADVELFEVETDRIQPSQFYVSREKLDSVASFVRTGRDVVVPLIPCGDRYISMDGHTRLHLAARMGIGRVLGFIARDNDDIFWFAEAAERRGVFTPAQLTELSAVEYAEKWNRFCDDYFASKRKDG